MKNLLFLAFFISVVVFLMTLSLYFYYITPVSEFNLQTTAFVTQDIVGFDVNSTAVTFGSFAVGGSSARSIAINNSFSFPVKVVPKVEGDISKIISYESMEIPPNQERSFRFTAYADSLDLVGNYSGNISVYLVRV